MLGYDFNHKLHRCERGVVMVFFAILLPLLFGFMGLSLDAGLAYVEKGKAQDIADATALAGAAHLASDGNHDMDAIKTAVQSFAVANGLPLQDGDLVEKAANAWDTKESVASGHQAVLAYGVVNVNNSEGTPVDRVRVRITKRVPVVFLSMVDGIADNIVVSAKAAAEGGSEVVAVVSGTPKMWFGQWNRFYPSAANIVVPSGYDLGIYASSNDIDPGMFPGTGTIYAASLKSNDFNYTFHYDDEKGVIVFTPPLPNNRDFIPNVGWSTYYAAYGHDDKVQAQIEQAKNVNQKFYNITSQCEAIANKAASEVEKYKNGEGDKRFIGWDPQKNKSVTNIRPEDREISLYVDGTLCDGWTANSDFISILTNHMLQNVKKINNLFTYKASLLIATDDIVYGNIYGINGKGLQLTGNRNKFEGVIYAKDNTYLGGYDNQILCSRADENGNTGLICNATLHVGTWNPIIEKFYKVNEWDSDLGQSVERDKYDVYTTSFVSMLDNPDWRLYIGQNPPSGGTSEGSGSGESGSESEGTSTTGKLRLVE